MRAAVMERRIRALLMARAQSDAGGVPGHFPSDREMFS
jgi:hypothetical protein